MARDAWAGYADPQGSGRARRGQSGGPRGSTAGFVRDDAFRVGRRRAMREGYATVELALTVPVVVLLLGAALWGVRVATERLGCLAAAQAGALALLRGEPVPSAVAVASADAPVGATVRVIVPVAGHAGQVLVSVVVAGPVVPIGSIWAVRVSARAVVPG